MRSTRRQTHFGKRPCVGDACLFRFELRTFDPCSFATYRTIKHTGQRLINHAESTLPVLCKPDLDGEIAIAVDETIRAVEWIDHPHARLAETSFCVN